MGHGDSLQGWRKDTKVRAKRYEAPSRQSDVDNLSPGLSQIPLGDFAGAEQCYIDAENELTVMKCGTMPG
jgi:hypothetical protein